MWRGSILCSPGRALTPHGSQEGLWLWEEAEQRTGVVGGHVSRIALAPGGQRRGREANRTCGWKTGGSGRAGLGWWLRISRAQTPKGQSRHTCCWAI